MRTIGLIGGMSWESTAWYYRLINERVRALRGPLCSADLLLHSVDFEPVERLQREGRWDEAGRLLAASAQRLDAAGAQAIALCTNTMHRVAGAIEEATARPFLHIADAAGAALQAAGVTTVGLLGTRFTMEQDFYAARLQRTFGIATVTPELAERQEIHRVIYEELCAGKIMASSRDAYLHILDALARRGAQAALLACTEIMMLLRDVQAPLPLFDTTSLHANACVAFALDG
ncbi:aspartate/glutamate racemase family protein [Tahibacter amnicola]|uniref:Aspartate/glutamate racemase family protein n=1 Tax=Tahibacter amnicola TaxID=2976241 RepID=A0ABY6B8F7_9GAMM|nr:aspartate/glutamate racemase family protein [Tahibacter amnicola]UXI66366.1 aspartate/glutamate racemase family protein [Tahibacter amnicola]